MNIHIQIIYHVNWRLLCPLFWRIYKIQFVPFALALASLFIQLILIFFS